VSLADLRGALQPQGALVRRMLLTVVAIAAIIIGILAMHAFSTGSHHAASADASSASGSHHDAAIAMSESPPALDTCGAGCEPADAMVAAACILALLIVVIVLIPPASRQALLQMLLGTIRIVPSGSLVRRRPPSLLVLSISRT
jgi:hypothetical protein